MQLSCLHTYFPAGNCPVVAKARASSDETHGIQGWINIELLMDGS